MAQINISYKENTKYGYASGRLRVLETRLLNRNSILRLLEADSAQEVIRLLSEGEYGSAFSSITSPLDFDIGLKTELRRAYALIDELSHDPNLTNIFRIKWDFHNLKALLKASYLENLKTGFDGIISDLGLIPLENLKLTVMPESDKKAEEVPDYIMDALNSARNQYESSQNPRFIDTIIDNHCYSFMFKQAEEFSNKFLIGYFKAVVDLNNIRNFVRIRMLSENIRLLDSILLPYGSLDKKVFIAHFDDPIESFASSLSNTIYSDVITEGIRKWTDEHSLATFEKLADNFLINYIKPAKYIIFGIEPLIGYLLAKENEIKLIRIIMTGKLNELPTEIINERLRDTYV
ncbi:MAG: V-type ATP synthase subunit C [Candidatus Poribacteria bacterium]